MASSQPSGVAPAIAPPLSPLSTTAESSSPNPTTNFSHPLQPVTSRNDGEAEIKKGEITPPVPMVHLRALVISGDSHVFTFEPETTVGRTKELIWSMWPSSWTSPAQPPSPSFLRILHAGRILSDDSTLASNNLPAVLGPTTPTVIHISVRSFSIRAEEDPKKTATTEVAGPRGSRAQDEVRSGCGCLIM